MPERVVILGSGGHAGETAWVCDAAGKTIAGFYDDEPQRIGHSVEEFSPDVLVLAEMPDDCRIVCGIGLPASRRDTLARWPASRWSFPIVHPSAVIGPNCRLGRATVIAAGCILTTGVTVSQGAYVNIGARIAHGSIIGAFANLSLDVNVAGNVRVEALAHVGAGAIILQGRTLGEGCRIGAGAVVTKDVPAGETWIGVPARRMDADRA